MKTKENKNDLLGNQLKSESYLSVLQNTFLYMGAYLCPVHRRPQGKTAHRMFSCQLY